MMLNQMKSDSLIDVISVSGSLPSGCQVRWSETNVIAVATLESIRLFELTIYSQNFDGITPFSIRRHDILPPTEIIECDFGIDKAKIRANDYEGSVRLKLDATLAPENFCGALYKGFQQALWSSKGVGPSRSCCLATLTADHWLALYIRVKGSWETAVVLSDILYSHLKSHNFTKSMGFEDKEQDSSKINLLMRRVYAVSSVKIEWSGIFQVDDHVNAKHDDFSCLFSAQKNGWIVIWKIKTCLQSGNDVEIFDMFNAEIGEISALHWIQLNQNSGLLIAGSVTGQCVCFQLNVKDKIELAEKNKTVLWQEKDKLRVSAICSYIILDKTFIIFSKGCYMFAYEVADLGITKIDHTSGLYLQFVTGMTSNDEGIVASTADGFLITAYVDISTKKLKCEKIFEHLEDKNQTYCGVCLSPNKILLCAVRILSVTYDHLAIREPITILFNSCFPIAKLLTNLETFVQSDQLLGEIGDILFYLFFDSRRNQTLSPQLSSMLHFDAEKLCDMTTAKLQLLRWLYYFVPSVEQVDDETSTANITKVLAIEDILIQRKLLSFLKMCNSDTLFLERGKLISRWFKSRTKNLNSVALAVLNSFDQINKDFASKATQKCYLCDSDVPLENFQFGRCVKGHELARCCYSFILIGRLNHRKCLKCSVFADNQAIELVQDYTCPFCSDVMW